MHSKAKKINVNYVDKNCPKPYNEAIIIYCKYTEGEQDSLTGVRYERNPQKKMVSIPLTK